MYMKLIPSCCRIALRVSRQVARQNSRLHAVSCSGTQENTSSIFGIMGTGLTLAFGLVALQSDTLCEATLEHTFSSDLPLMTLVAMEKMREDGRVVVSFQGIVYDVTDFTGHPGGYGRLEMASGEIFCSYGCDPVNCVCRL